MKLILPVLALAALGSTWSNPVIAEIDNAPQTEDCAVEFMILGIGQDGGAPQIDRQSDPGWTSPELRLFAASGALIDHRNGKRFLFEATPDIREQLYALNANLGIAQAQNSLGLSGVFVTHAHIGHYAGLMFAGHESAGTNNLKVFAMPRMKDYLESNGPWDQLVRYKNIVLEPLHDGSAISIGQSLSVTPHLVPHRDEYSETVGFVISGPSKNVLFLPDIDDWDRWEDEFGLRIEDVIATVDIAYLDATFFDDNELPGRDMSRIPHPRLLDSMRRFSSLAKDEQKKVRFFHINHTNKARFENSKERQIMSDMGFTLARQNERECLD
jgi:pyrroloquinoline quinone biosynthesis protein B